MNDDPKDPYFDWVKARSKCSPAEMLETLRELVRAGTEHRNLAFATEDKDGRFKFADLPNHAGNGFKVWDTWGESRNAVVFSLYQQGKTIRVTPSYGAPVNVGLTLTDDALCVFELEGAQLLPWQLLRRFLEPVLFRADA